MSEPHEVLPTAKLTLHFMPILSREGDKYLPVCPTIYTTVPVLFFANGRLYDGLYHSNGNFYSDYCRFRGRITSPLYKKPNTIGDGDVTHWCLFPTIVHPDFVIPCSPSKPSAS